MNQATPTTAPRLRLVTRERRSTPRVQGPFNATWSGASGPGCRVQFAEMAPEDLTALALWIGTRARAEWELTEDD